MLLDGSALGRVGGRRIVVAGAGAEARRKRKASGASSTALSAIEASQARYGASPRRCSPL
jgi:hypothetical protein